MKWIPLTTSEQLIEIKNKSFETPILLFKHSTTCSISNTTLNRLERNWKEEEWGGTKSYYLDLLAYRTLSNEIAAIFEVEHESPQVLIIQNGKSVYNASHFDIDYVTIKNKLAKLQPKATTA